MADVVNLRGARKAKARAEKEAKAAANRARFGTPKATRTLTRARSDKDDRELDAHQLDDDKSLEP
jgi:hypothetical protein